MIKNLLFKSSIILFCFSFILSQYAPIHAQIDSDASEKTRALYENLKLIQSSNNFMFGQEFYNSFRYNSGSAHGDKAYSDSKEVTGAHPAVLGSDFHYYLEKNATERNFHTEAVKYAYQQGAVITFDWHLSGRGTTTYEYQESTKNLVNNIIQNLNGDKDWYLGELDKAIDIVNNDLVVDGERIPIVFRPLHEMNGGWFWWGSQSTDAENYKALFKLTVDYFKENTNTVLYCWSPNAPVSMDHYPGNEYVDILGVDGYEVTASSLRAQLAIIVDHAQSHNKVAVFAETGNRTNVGASPGDDAAFYWKNTILPAILDDPSGKAKKIAWVLTWINASWSYPYVPYPNSSQLAKQSFMDFRNSHNALFLDEIPDMYTEVVLAIGDDKEHNQKEIQLYPLPTKDFLTVRINDIQLQSNIGIYDMNGKIIYDAYLQDVETTINISQFLKPGVYLLKISDAKNNIIKRILVE